VLVLTGECSTIGGRSLEAFQKPLQKIADRCRERGATETDQILGSRGKLLATYESSLVQLPGQDRYKNPIELPVEAARLRLFNSLAETFTALATQETVLIIIDDLQWSDELVLGFLSYIIQTNCFARERLLLVGTYRLESLGPRLQRLTESRDVENMVLSRLDDSAVSTIINDMLAMTPAPPSLTRFLTHQSEGNPFFVAEYLRAAVEEGILFRDDHGKWHIRTKLDEETSSEQIFQNLSRPLSLQELIDRRLIGLPASAQDVIKAAAILGRAASVILLRDMTRKQTEDFYDDLAELVKRQIFEKSGDELIRFAHAKIYEVALERILPLERQQLHRTAANGIQSLFADQLDKYYAELGRHWQGTGETEVACTWYFAAARRALTHYDYGEAISNGHHNRAVKILWFAMS